MRKYEEIRLLGEGSYGKAILCKRRRDEKFFVIKEIRMANLSMEDRESALNEANLLSSLNHPYIVKYEESFQERGCFYIVMEYADGGDLAEKIKNRKKYFTENEVLHTFIQIALAVKYIHDHKILHRDLKAQNIFLMKDGTVKLGDFGIARVLENTFQLCHTRIGTPYYLSPEICEGKTYNSKTDIWSLGCILYELCTLRHAFNAQNMSALVVQIIRGKYDPIPSCFSSDLSKLISHMLISDQRTRPSINGVLNSPILKTRLHFFLSESPTKKTQIQQQIQIPVLKSPQNDAEKIAKPQEAEKIIDMKHLDEILKRKNDDQKKHKQQIINKHDAIFKNHKFIPGLDTIGQIRYNEFAENRMAAMKNKQRANFSEYEIEKSEIPEDSFIREMEDRKPLWASPTNSNSNYPVWINLESSAQNDEIDDKSGKFSSCISSSFSAPELSLSRSSSEERRRRLMEQRAAMQANRKTLKSLENQNQELTNSSLEFDLLSSKKGSISSSLSATPTPLVKMSNSPSSASKKPSIKTPLLSSPRSISALSPVLKSHESELNSHSTVSSVLPNLPEVEDAKYNESKKLLNSSTADASLTSSRSRLRELGLDPNLAQNEKDRKILMDLDMELSQSSISQSCGDIYLSEQLMNKNDDNKPRPLIQASVNEAKSHLSQIHSLVSSIKSVLKMPNDSEDIDNSFEIPTERPISRDLINKEVRFPIVSDNDSLMYRAEAMRAFLERELGVDEFIALRHEIESENNGEKVISKYPNVLPGIVVILQQLLILEHLIEDM